MVVVGRLDQKKCQGRFFCPSPVLDKGTGDVNLIAAVEFIYKMLNKKSGELENTGESQENTGNTDNNYKKITNQH